MPRQRVVKLGGDALDGRQPGPRHGGEIMMLVVKTDVVGEPVERAVVGEGLGDRDAVIRVARRGGDGLVDVVLCDEVAGERVQAAGEERGEEEVEESVGGGYAQEDKVEGELNDNVEEVNLGKGHAVDSHGTDGVEEDLEGAKEGLAEDRIEQEGLERGRQVGVKAIDAEALVVGKMVRLYDEVLAGVLSVAPWPVH